MKKISVLIIAIVMLVAITGIVMADTGVPAVPEHQGIATTTIANAEGTVMESDATAMTLTNNPTVMHVVGSAGGLPTILPPGNPIFTQNVAQLTALGGSVTWHVAGPNEPNPGLITIDSISVPDSAMNVIAVQVWFGFGPNTWGQIYANFLALPGFMASDVTQGIHTGMLSPGQVQYSTTYDLDVVAQAGTTAMQKTNKITTENTLPGQFNLDMPLSLTFIATGDGGNVHGTEDIMFDGAAQAQNAETSMLCPFGAGPTGSIIPPFSNIMQAGGAFDLTVGSVTTAANNRFIQTDASNPTSLNYEINVKPYGTTQGQIPAIGSASAYYKLHIQEGRTASNTVSEDWTSSETSSVSGVITGFTKKIQYLDPTMKQNPSVPGSTPTKLPSGSSGGPHIIYASVGVQTEQEYPTSFTAWIEPSGEIEVPDHGSQTFTMGTNFELLPNGKFSTINGNGPADVWVDGVYQGSISSYPFTDVTEDHTIIVYPVYG